MYPGFARGLGWIGRRMYPGFARGLGWRGHLMYPGFARGLGWRGRRMCFNNSDNSSIADSAIVPARTQTHSFNFLRHVTPNLLPFLVSFMWLLLCFAATAFSVAALNPLFLLFLGVFPRNACRRLAQFQRIAKKLLGVFRSLLDRLSSVDFQNPKVGLQGLHPTKLVLYQKVRKEKIQYANVGV